MTSAFWWYPIKVDTIKGNWKGDIKNGKSQSQIAREYGVSLSALGRWIKLFSEVKLDDQTVMTAKQIKELQKRNALLEEENLILKYAAA